MTTPCNRCPLQRTSAFRAFTEGELGFMKRFKVGEPKIEAGTPILMEGPSSLQLYTVLRGMGVCYKLLEAGARQVVNFVFPGDFLGLQAGIMGEMGHSLEASMSMSLCVFDRKNFWRLSREQPERAFDLTWFAAGEEHFLGEGLLTIGQRSGSDRLGLVAAGRTCGEARSHAGKALASSVPPAGSRGRTGTVRRSHQQDAEEAARTAARRVVGWPPPHS